MFAIYSLTPETWGDHHRLVESFDTKEDADSVLKVLELVNTSFNLYKIIELNYEKQSIFPVWLSEKDKVLLGKIEKLLIEVESINRYTVPGRVVPTLEEIEIQLMKARRILEKGK